MRNVQKALPLLALAMLPVAALADQVPVVEVGANQIFVPQGFDSNDDVQVVVEGYLPSTCYKATEPKVKVDDDTRTVTITPQAYLLEPPCAQVRVPYTITAHVGHMMDGTWTVKSSVGSVQASLPVKAATSSATDDFPYAPVDSVRLEGVRPGQPEAVYLEGRYTTTCMDIERVDVIVASPSVLELLPVMRDLGEGPECVEKEVPFSFRVELPQGLASGRYLLHVRSLNGRAVNQVFPVFAVFE